MKNIKLGIDVVAILTPLVLGTLVVSPFILYSAVRLELEERKRKRVE